MTNVTKQNFIEQTCSLESRAEHVNSDKM